MVGFGFNSDSSMDSFLQRSSSGFGMGSHSGSARHGCFSIVVGNEFISLVQMLPVLNRCRRISIDCCRISSKGS